MMTRSSRGRIVARSHHVSTALDSRYPSYSVTIPSLSWWPTTPVDRGKPAAFGAVTCRRGSFSHHRGRGIPKIRAAVMWLKYCPGGIHAAYALTCIQNDASARDAARTPWNGRTRSRACSRLSPTPAALAALRENGAVPNGSGSGAGRRTRTSCPFTHIPRRTCPHGTPRLHELPFSASHLGKSCSLARGTRTTGDLCAGRWGGIRATRPGAPGQTRTPAPPPAPGPATPAWRRSGSRGSSRLPR
jgi:hypothetical protein